MTTGPIRQPDHQQTTGIRKPYVAPSIIDYGSAAKLTRSVGTTGVEAAGMMNLCL